MFSYRKRTTKEFKEGLYRRPAQSSLPKENLSHNHLFTFNKMPATALDYTKSPLVTFNQQNINSSNLKDEWFGGKLKGFEFTFNNYLSKKKAIQLDIRLSQYESEQGIDDQQAQVSPYLTGTFIESRGVLVKREELRYQYESDDQQEYQQIAPMNYQSFANLASINKDNQNQNYYQSQDEKDSEEYDNAKGIIMKQKSRSLKIEQRANKEKVAYY